MKQLYRFLTAALALAALLPGLNSCKNDPAEEVVYATLDDMSIRLEVNDKSSEIVTDRGDAIVYTTAVGFGPERINWPQPTIEQTLSELLSVAEKDITVTYGDGTAVRSVETAVDSGRIAVRFGKSDGGYDHLRGETVTLRVNARIAEETDDKTLESLRDSGFGSSSIFYGQNGSQRITSDTVTVYPRIDRPEEEFADISGVGIRLTVGGQEGFELEDRSQTIEYAAQLRFEDLPIDWPAPTFEQRFADVVTFDTKDVKISGSHMGEIGTAKISAEGDTLRVAFSRMEGGYDYLRDATVTIEVPARIKSDVRHNDLAALKEKGFESRALFHSGDPDDDIESEPATVYPQMEYEEPYDVVGDPQNGKYPYKLNVVYFVPSDITPNPDYEERISTLLLNFQLFVCEWMEHWGYGYRSFGLPLRDNGMVEIITIRGEGVKADYPYSSGVSVPKMQREINDYYAAHGLKSYSDHTLVITATNASSDNTPFYGYGRWCFALDYPGMSQESLPTTKSSYIGGLMHELGHGLTMPHVGPTYSQKNDPDFGTPLMGSGNQTYGRRPTFFHQSSAAALSNCQLSSFSEKAFYGKVNAKVNAPTVIVDGDRCTVRGRFTTDRKATDVIVRFYNESETFLGGSAGYTSVAFVTKPINNDSYEITIPIEELRVNKYRYKIGITVLNDNGVRSNVTSNDVYTLVNDGGGYTLTTPVLGRYGWTVTTSHRIPTDNSISNAPGSLVDGDQSTCLSLVKPGKSMDGISVPASDKVYAVIDMQKESTFNTITLGYRSDNKYDWLRASRVSFYGSNDGVTFEPVQTDVELDTSKDTNTVTLGGAVTYRYLKMTYDKWNASSGSTMQFSELSLSLVE